MSASNLTTSAISSTMNSDEVSRSLDASANLENFVRLSFCAKNPMMYVAYKEGRISKPTLLEIKLEVVSRPGVQFIAMPPDWMHATQRTRTSCDLMW